MYVSLSLVSHCISVTQPFTTEIIYEEPAKIDRDEIFDWNQCQIYPKRK
jgi:hypothetical protein